MARHPRPGGSQNKCDASGIIPARSPNTPTTTERSHSETSSYSGGRSSFRFAWRSGRAGNACRCHRCRRSGDAHFIDQESGAVEDGLNLVRRIRSGWPSLHIVVMTALTNTAILRAIVSDSVVSTLSKMETMDELWQAIEAASRGKVYIGRSIIEALAQPPDEACDLPPVPRLSRRQAEVIRLFVRGQSISEIAVALGCHRRTVTRQKREAMAKLGVANDPGLFAYVRAHGVSVS
jgi:two-component system capsular synthesis response regulator RcsB